MTSSKRLRLFEGDWMWRWGMDVLGTLLCVVLFGVPLVYAICQVVSE